MIDPSFEETVRNLPTDDIVYALAVLRGELNRRLGAILGPPTPPAEPRAVSAALERARAWNEKRGKPS